MPALRPLHVAINARAMCFSPHGSGKYVERITEILAAEGVRVTLLAPSSLDQHYDIPQGMQVIVHPSRSLLAWEEQLLPPLLNTHKPDIYFAATGRGIPRVRRKHTLYILGMLDVIPWRFPFLTFGEPPRFWTLRHEAFPQLISWARAHHIWTISRPSRKDILAFTPSKSVTGIPYPMTGTPIAPCTNPRQQFVYVGG
ncbi:MAG: hypothetical protein J6386_14060 [Candidatus Synoicihabitans palmerolidicus]|nr:hypothetical protein [Candidatus Synoicihabitans palmerolidicus]